MSPESYHFAPKTSLALTVYLYQLIKKKIHFSLNIYKKQKLQHSHNDGITEALKGNDEHFSHEFPPRKFGSFILYQ